VAKLILFKAYLKEHWISWKLQAKSAKYTSDLMGVLWNIKAIAPFDIFFTMWLQ
jgi:hypothetical protein